jgi:hypothetical protein
MRNHGSSRMPHSFLSCPVGAGAGCGHGYIGGVVSLASDNDAEQLPGRPITRLDPWRSGAGCKSHIQDSSPGARLGHGELAGRPLSLHQTEWPASVFSGTPVAVGRLRLFWAMRLVIGGRGAGSGGKSTLVLGLAVLCMVLYVVYGIPLHSSVDSPAGRDPKTDFSRLRTG